MTPEYLAFGQGYMKTAGSLAEATQAVTDNGCGAVYVRLDAHPAVQLLARRGASSSVSIAVDALRRHRGAGHTRLVHDIERLLAESAAAAVTAWRESRPT